MGNCISENKNSNAIDSKLKKLEEYENSCHKLLFLGPGGGGKSTIFKQLQYLHGDGFADKGSLVSLKSHINMQIIKQMHAAIKHYLSGETSDKRLQNAIQTVKTYDLSEKEPILTEELTDAISFIWQNDDRLRGIFNTYGDQQILWQTTEYFWNELDRISSPHYLPSQQDIVKVRNMSTGVVEKRFGIKEHNFHIFDVGGQKSERKKWLKCFDDVTMVIFVVALSCYHELMFEDRTTNCMVDAINLFENTINHTQFINTPIVLFLNKMDLFEKKIKKVPITVCPTFDDFDEETVYGNDDSPTDQSAAEYIKMKFEALNTSPRRIYTHLTCATDETKINHVFNAVVNVVLVHVHCRLQKQNLV